MPGDASYQETVPSQTDTGSGFEENSWFSGWEAEIPDEPTFAELVFAKYSYKDLQGQPPDGSRCGDRTPDGNPRFIQFFQSYNDSEDELKKQAKLDKKSEEGKIIGLEDHADILRLYNAFVLVAEPGQEWNLRLHMDFPDLFSEKSQSPL